MRLRFKEGKQLPMNGCDGADGARGDRCPWELSLPALPSWSFCWLLSTLLTHCNANSLAVRLCFSSLDIVFMRFRHGPVKAESVRMSEGNVAGERLSLSLRSGPACFSDYLYGFHSASTFLGDRVAPESDITGKGEQPAPTPNEPWTRLSSPRRIQG